MSPQNIQTQKGYVMLKKILLFGICSAFAISASQKEEKNKGESAKSVKDLSSVQCTKKNPTGGLEFEDQDREKDKQEQKKQKENDSSSTDLRSDNTGAVVKRIQAIADEIAKKMYDNYRGILDRDNKELADFCYKEYCTKSGLLLYVGSYPSALATPKGPEQIFGSGLFMGDYACAIATKFFFERVKVKFVGSYTPTVYRDLSNKKITYFDVTIDNEKREAVWKKLTQQEYDAAKGTDKHIISSNRTCDSVYEVQSVDGIELHRPQS